MLVVLDANLSRSRNRNERTEFSVRVSWAKPLNRVPPKRGQARTNMFERYGNPQITAKAIEGRLREFAFPQAPTE